MEQPTSLDIVFMEQHIEDNVQPNLIAAFAVALVIGYTAVVLRLIARWRVRASLEADDWFILVALGMLTAFSIDSFMMVHFGLGRHIIMVTNMEGLVQSIVAGEVLYTTSIIPIKISVLFLYCRLFPSRTLTRVSIGLGIFILGYTVAQAISMMAQCIPLSTLWTHEGGQCININAVLTTMGVLNVLTDLIIMALPVPFLLGLRIERSRKAQLFGMFALGGCVAIFGIVRAIMVGTSDPRDFSWSNVHGLLWSVLEISFGIVSACLPTLRPLFVRCPGRSMASNCNSKGMTSNGSGTASQQSNAHSMDVKSDDMSDHHPSNQPAGNGSDADDDDDGEKAGFGRAAAGFLGFAKVRAVDEVLDSDARRPWAKLGEAERKKEEAEAEAALVRARSVTPNQIFVRTEIKVEHKERKRGAKQSKQLPPAPTES